MRIVVALAGLLLVAAAPEPGRPPPLPTRDVDVTYATGTLTQRMRWSAAERKLRVDPPSVGLHIITDFRAGKAYAVRDGDRTVLTTPAAEPAGKAPLRRVSQDRVAGLDCTEWETVDSNGQPTVACITADGVLLRARGGGRVLVEATRVDFSRVDGSVFVVPGDYARGN